MAEPQGQSHYFTQEKAQASKSSPNSSARIGSVGGHKATPMGGIAENQGSLPNVFDSAQSPQGVDVVEKFPWTLSKVDNRDDVPYIILKEQRTDESTLRRNISFYAQGYKDLVKNLGSAPTKSMLQVYDDIWPDNPTGWTYRLPYFSKSQFELSTPQWQKVDGIGEGLKSVMGGLSRAGKGIGGRVGNVVSTIASGAVAAGTLAADAGGMALKLSSPVVGAVDRPSQFKEHSDRSITIEFPLYNTIKPQDWTKNRDFWYIFASQNLFLKRDFVTGMPPVYYRIYIPGQYYCHAACVTKFEVTNLGNIRAYENYLVPDAYQISITLQEMVMPSLNQFQAVLTGQAAGRVTVK